jgi:hypothetical protein
MGIRDLVPLPSTFNNKRYIGNCSFGTVLVKQYTSDSDDAENKLEREFSMLTFLWDHNIRCIPEPLIADTLQRTAIYRYIEGKPIPVHEIDNSNIIELTHILIQMWQLRLIPRARLLSNAFDASFTIKQYVETIHLHINKFTSIPQSDSHAVAIHSFINSELIPFFTVMAENAAKKPYYSFTINTNMRTISPSDIGFHTILRIPNGELFFPDFEYSGWDDPVRMVADTLIQPANPLNLNHQRLLLKSIKELLHPIESVVERMEYVYPLIGIQWCLILLNNFLPAHVQKNPYSIQYFNNDNKNEQIVKAAKLLNTIKQQHSENYIINLLKSAGSGK